MEGLLCYLCHMLHVHWELFDHHIDNSFEISCYKNITGMTTCVKRCWLKPHRKKHQRKRNTHRNTLWGGEWKECACRKRQMRGEKLCSQCMKVHCLCSLLGRYKKSVHAESVKGNWKLNSCPVPVLPVEDTQVFLKLYCEMINQPFSQ